MRAKLVYIMEKEDIEVLRKAKGIINLLYNAEVEFDNDAVKKDLLNEFGDIEHMCIDSLVTDEAYRGSDESDGDEDEDKLYAYCEHKLYAYCEHCGCAIYEEDTRWIAADGSICCCDECLVAHNRELPYDDEEDE